MEESSVLGRPNSQHKEELISLVLLTIGVMLCNLKDRGAELTGGEMVDSSRRGIIATLGIALCSGFASVYTEKVIKAKRNVTQQLPSKSDDSPKGQYGLAYTQVQLAFVRYDRDRCKKWSTI